MALESNNKKDNEDFMDTTFSETLRHAPQQQQTQKFPPDEKQQQQNRTYNPYAVKRSRTSPPAEAVSLFSLVPKNCNNTENNSDAGGEVFETLSSRALSKDSCSRSTHTTQIFCRDDADHDGSNPAATNETNYTSPVGDKSGVVAFSNFEPRWKRLPSQKVSFGSAEILTVTELLQHAHHFRDRSVRVTGVLQHRHIHGYRMHHGTTDGIEIEGNDEAHVILLSLVLTDPLAPPKAKKKLPPRSSILPARRISFGKSPVPSVDASLKSGSKQGSEVVAQTPISKPRSVMTPGAFKTPSSAGSNNSGSSLLKSTPSTTPRYIGMKRPLSATRTSGVEAIVEDLAEHVGVWIVLDPKFVSINDCAVGDLVMIIGEVRSMEDDDMIGSNHEVRFIHNYLLKRRGEQNALHLRARIAKNVNGTNMQLQHEALLLRRQSLRAAWSAPSEKSNEPVIRSGCGPPDPISER